MDVQKWLEDIRTSPVKKPMPILSFPSIQLLGCTVNELVMDSALQAKGMKAVADRVDSCASVSMMDLSVEAEAFGAQARITDDEVPTIVGHIVETQEEADALEVPAVGAGRTGIYVEAIRQAVGLITDRPVLAGVIGPFSLAGRLMGVSDAMIYCYDDPDMVHTVLKKATAFLIEYIKAYKAVGASGVLMAEPLAGLLPPAMNDEFSIPYVKEIREAVEDDSFLFGYHNCGDAVPRQMESLAELKLSVYHMGNATPMKVALENLPADSLVMGNIDPAGQFCNGTPDSIREATRTLLEECSSYPNFVISSGCDIPPASRWDNIDAFFQETADFYQK